MPMLTGCPLTRGPPKAPDPVRVHRCCGAAENPLGAGVVGGGDSRLDSGVQCAQPLGIRRGLRDNPRVSWALRDLCNPWTWAYSMTSRRDGLTLAERSALSGVGREQAAHPAVPGTRGPLATDPGQR